MVILKYNQKYHKQIMRSCADALCDGKVLAYPTDTSYGLAVDATSAKAIKKLYKIKGRLSNKPVHIIVPSLVYAKGIAVWNKIAQKLARKFWPGPLTLVLELRSRKQELKTLSAGTGYIGLRMPDNKIALDLAKYLKQPITTTSANISGSYDSYSAANIIKQFQKGKYKPDIVINAGVLPKRKPSTVIKTIENKIEVLRPGPIAENKLR
jgi:L-threonylcarbamoyladenylate synthase